jgi:hypothetical protein
MTAGDVGADFARASGGAGLSGEVCDAPSRGRSLIGILIHRRSIQEVKRQVQGLSDPVTTPRPCPRQKPHLRVMRHIRRDR